MWANDVINTKNRIDKNNNNKSSNFLSNSSFNELYGALDDNQTSRNKEKLLQKKQEREFGEFMMVQDFPAHIEAIWVAEFSPNCDYLATGSKDGIVKIWKILGVEYDEEPFSLFEETPHWELIFHSEPNCSILDISWCVKVPNYLLVGRLDSKAFLWDIHNPEIPASIFEHEDAVTGVAFHPESEEEKMVFVTGWLDKSYRVWINNETEPEWTQQAKDYITAISVSPDGARVVIGLHMGQIIVWSYDNYTLNYITSIECKNRLGKYSKGTKVTSIIFLDNTDVLVTTNDSRIRIVNVEGRYVESGTKQMKFKGHKNDNLQIKATISEDMSFIICGSEDGYVYLWNKYTNDNEIQNKEKNENNEKFAAFAPDMSIPTTTLFLPLTGQRIFMHKYALCGTGKILK